MPLITELIVEALGNEVRQLLKAAERVASFPLDVFVKNAGTEADRKTFDEIMPLLDAARAVVAAGKKLAEPPHPVHVS
jgi:hypothetical protein